MNEQKPVLEMENVTVSFHGKPVLKCIDCKLLPKTVTAVIGPSGTGKTTLLRTLSRMNDREKGFRLEGRVLMRGQDIYDRRLDVYRHRRKVAYISQDPCAFPKSVYENVVFGFKRLQPGRKKEFPRLVERMLRSVFLWDEVKDRLNQPADKLSQGQRQRLALARSLAVEPEIVLMDEPTSALDPKSAAAIEALVESLKKTHTVIWVTHNLQQARRVSDRVLFFCGGSLCESGPTEAFFANPSRRESREYIEAQIKKEIPESGMAELRNLYC